jgi:hypothetical protein
MEMTSCVETTNYISTTIDCYALMFGKTNIAYLSLE